MISVILPAYNERENICRLVVDIHSELANYAHEILVVDDDSPDGTANAVKGLKLNYVRVVPRLGPRGLAASILDGILEAKGEALIIMDSDFNHQPKYLSFMVESLKHYECVSASRFLYGGNMDSWFRLKASWAFNVFTRALTGGALTDSLYGFLAIRREVLARCPFHLIFWGYGDYYIRLMYYVQKMNIPILQFPAVNGRRLHGLPNPRLFSVLFKYTFEVLRLVLMERLLHHVSRNRPMPGLRQHQPE